MENYYSFCQKNNLSFVPVCVNYEIKNGKDVKNVKLLGKNISGWNKEGCGFIEGNHNRITLTSAEEKTVNGHYINIHSKFIILDTDEIKGEETLNKLFEEYNLYDNFKTSSFSNILKGKTYKNHYWFRLKEPIKYTKIIDFNNLGLDVITDFIGEHIDTKFIKYDNIPYFDDRLISYFNLKKSYNSNDGFETDKSEASTIILNDQDNEYSLEYHKELMKLADNKYKDNYQDWIKFLFCCKNENKNDNSDYFDFFVDYSKSSTNKKYQNIKISEYRKYWNNIRIYYEEKRKFTFGSIAKEISEDKPQEYKLLRTKYFTKEAQRINNFVNKNILDKEEQNKLIQNKYLEIKKRVEKSYFKCIETASFFKYSDNDLIAYSEKDINFIFKNEKLTDKIYFSKMWMDDPEILTYDKIDFIPGIKSDTKIFNKFTGFKYDFLIKEDYDENKIKPILDFIKYICDNNNIAYNFLLDWVAYIIQKPNQKTKIAPILYSNTHGIGKNTFTYMIQKLFENYETEIANIDELTKNFNYNLSFKLLVVGDEITANAKILSDFIKNIITRQYMTCEKKGFDAFKIKDYTNYIFTTNNEFCFKIEDSDRRFYPIHCNENKQDKKYYQNIYNLLEDTTILKNLHYYFKMREIPENLDVDNNEYKKKYINHNLPSYIKMVYDEYEIFASNSWNSIQIKSMFEDYAKRKHMSTNFSPEKITRDFKKEFGEYYTKDNKGNRIYKFPENNILVEELNKKRSGLIFIL